MHTTKGRRKTKKNGSHWWCEKRGLVGQWKRYWLYCMTLVLALHPALQIQHFGNFELDHMYIIDWYPLTLLFFCKNKTATTGVYPSLVYPTYIYYSHITLFALVFSFTPPFFTLYRLSTRIHYFLINKKQNLQHFMVSMMGWLKKNVVWPFVYVGICVRVRVGICRCVLCVRVRVRVFLLYSWLLYSPPQFVRFSHTY